MSKHLIKSEKTPHGVIGWASKGNDNQYCEAGEVVRLRWQPDAKWGLLEAHYTDEGGNVVAIENGEFVMPASNVVIGGTFKRFVLPDWTGDQENEANEVVATALCQLNERVAAIETRQTLSCLNLVVDRKFDMIGWRLVDEQIGRAS